MKVLTSFCIFITFSISSHGQTNHVDKALSFKSLPLKEQSYVIENSNTIEDLQEQTYGSLGISRSMNILKASYTLWEKDGVQYILPSDDAAVSTFNFLELEAIKAKACQKVDSFKDWVRQYDGKFLNESSFDLMDEWNYSFSTPLNSLRSYWHARANCDVEVIFKHSDPSFLKYLERNTKWTLLATPRRSVNDGLTKVTPLLTGICEMGGIEYTMIFYRRECPSNPKSETIHFYWNFYVYANDIYYLSDAPSRSQFGNMIKVMKLGYIYPGGKYDYLVDKLKTTSMPEIFYTIDNSPNQSIEAIATTPVD